MPALAKALSDGNEDVRVNAAWALGNAARNGADIAVAMPALVGALSDGDTWVKANAAWALEKVIEKYTSIEPLNEMETKLQESYDSVKKRYLSPKDAELVGIGLMFSRLMNAIAKARNELTPQRDILLDDIPKPPKKGEIYRIIRGTVRNG